MTLFVVIPAPSAAPTNLTYSATTDSLTFTWDEIPCGSRGGDIVRYDYISDIDIGYVTTRSKTFSSLVACTSHVFNVTGVNGAGTGPYTDEIIGTTDTVGKF